jgi:putative glutamine amidotransferase
MTRPRIGISAYWRVASWGLWTAMPACMVPQGYVEGIRTANGVPLLIPPDPVPDPDDAAVILDVLDGLIFVGGEDIGPASYGAEPHPETDPPNERRDRAELALLRGALTRDLPVLGICRGFQLLNIVYGGDLVQHVADQVDPAPHRPALGTFGRHDVIVTGGKLHEIYGAHVRQIHSHHHQALGRIGHGLHATGHAPDGLIEAVEDAGKPFCLGVLWHPEEEPATGGAPLFRALVDHARAYHATRA